MFVNKVIWQTWYTTNIAAQRNYMSRKTFPPQCKWSTFCMVCCTILLEPHIIKVIEHMFCNCSQKFSFPSFSYRKSRTGKSAIGSLLDEHLKHVLTQCCRVRTLQSLLLSSWTNTICIDPFSNFDVRFLHFDQIIVKLQHAFLWWTG